MKLGASAYERRLCIFALGGRCKNCGNDEFDVLELDHIYGDGFLLVRRKYGGQQRGGNASIFKRARLSGRLHEIYQVLCANCHRKKSKQSGEQSGKKRRDITDITTPALPLFDWGEIPPFAEIQLRLPK